MVVIYTFIDGISIPVQPGPLTRVFFSGDCEERDKPEEFWDFWTMERVQGTPLTGRCRTGGYPGQRFEKTNTAQTATLVRPSSAQEVEDWLNNPDHIYDAPCARFGEVNDHPIRIGRDPVDAHYIVQTTPSPTEPSPS
jgi:hypothetical protein